LAGGLCVVYVLPEMTDIGQLCLLIAAAAALGGWVATGSDLISYAGMQAAFAFFLTLLQGYAPDTDLTAPRDRVVGILLGNVLMTFVFSLLWPTSAVDRARSSLAVALRSLARLMSDECDTKTGSRLAVIRALGEARRFVTLAAFELRMLPARAWLERTGGISLEALDRIAAAGFVVVNQARAPEIADAARRHDQAVSAWLTACADRVAPGRGKPRRHFQSPHAPTCHSRPLHPGQRHLSAPPSMRANSFDRNSRMPLPCRASRHLRYGHKAAVMACLLLAACATDRVALAPETPDRAWKIPPSLDDLPLPGTRPAARNPSGGAAASAAPAPSGPSSNRAGVVAESQVPRGNSVQIDPARRYDLAGLIDLAQRDNPETRGAWEQARQAALAVGLVEASLRPTDLR